MINVSTVIPTNSDVVTMAKHSKKTEKVQTVQNGSTIIAKNPNSVAVTMEKLPKNHLMIYAVKLPNTDAVPITYILRDTTTITVVTSLVSDVAWTEKPPKDPTETNVASILPMDAAQIIST